MSDKEKKSSNKPEEQSNFPTISLPDSSAVIGGEIGPYRLLSVLGEGGFGIVYLAEQKHPVKRTVALKVIKPGMDTKQVIARFEAERQALALLEHPNIARVYNAGSTETGRPYFVMEYIKGSPITEYCDHHKVSIKERLELFIQVCEAVQHAHQKGIIHRDIKPSNIVVTSQDGKAVPKVIDFGVAKAISMPLTEKTMFTQQGQLIGTPEYMSPEQADLKEKDIDTRTDIYSLGVVLYELLAGTLPFEPKTLREGGYAEIQRIIREQEPPRPSTKLSSLGENATKVAQSRHTELSVLVKSLHKELEWIPLMAIRKERDQRYKTASDLAEDVQNYLDGNPLVAGPESIGYKAKKLMQKRKGALVSSIFIILLVSMVIGYFNYSKKINIKQFKIQAKNSFEKGQYIDAKDNYNKVLGIDKEDPEAIEGVKESEISYNLSIATEYLKDSEYQRAGGIADVLQQNFPDDPRVINIARQAKGTAKLYVEFELGEVLKATLSKIQANQDHPEIELSPDELLAPNGTDINPGWYWLSIDYKPVDEPEVQFDIRKHLLFVQRSKIYRLQCKKIIVGNDSKADFIKLEDALKASQPGNIICLLPGEHMVGNPLPGIYNKKYSTPNLTIESYNFKNTANLIVYRMSFVNTWDLSIRNLRIIGKKPQEDWADPGLIFLDNNVLCVITACNLDVSAIDARNCSTIEIANNIFTSIQSDVHHRSVISDSHGIVIRNNTINSALDGWETFLQSNNTSVLFLNNNLSRSALKGLDVESCSNVIIVGNSINGNFEGNVNLFNTNRAVLTFNRLLSGNFYNLRLFGSSNAIIKHNISQYSNAGIYLLSSHGSNFQHNLILRANTGILCSEAAYNTIENNIFKDNKVCIQGEGPFWGVLYVNQNIMDWKESQYSKGNTEIHEQDNFIHQFDLGNFSDDINHIPLIAKNESDAAMFETHDYGPDFTLKENYLAYCNSLADKMLDFDKTDLDILLDVKLGEPLISRTQEIASNILQMDLPNIDEKELEKDFEDKMINSLVRLAKYHLSNPRPEINSKKLALEAARNVCEFTDYQNPQYLSILAEAYTQANNFENAIKWQEKALKVIPEKEKTDWTNNHRLKMKLYRSGMSYREYWALPKEEPMLWWKFDEPIVETAVDSSRNGFDAEINGLNPEFDIRNGHSLELDGIDDYAKAGILDIRTNTLTITAWIRRNGNQVPYATILTSKPNISKQGDKWGINLSENNEIRYLWGNDWDTDLFVPDGKWVFTALVVEPQKATVYLYNEKLQEQIFTRKHKVLHFDNLIGIGLDNRFGGQRFFKGGFGDIRVYNRSLSKSEILELCNNEIAQQIKSLPSIASLDEKQYRIEAVNNAIRACEFTKYRNHKYISALAAAYSEVGDFEKALEEQQKAIGIISQGEQGDLMNKYAYLLSLYKSKQPYSKGNPWSFSSGELVARWEFDQFEGDKVKDSSGNGLDGKLIGDAKIFDDPQRGKVLSLDGDGDYIDCGNDWRFDISGSITISVWTKKSKPQNSLETLISKGRAWNILKNGDVPISFFLEGPIGGLWRCGIKPGTSLKDITDGRWHHITATFDGKKMSLYRDGKLDSERVISLRININKDPIFIGNRSGTPRYWQGLIDDVFIYSRALSESEVTELYIKQSQK